MRQSTLLLSAMLWLSIFVMDAISNCSFSQAPAEAVFTRASVVVQQPEMELRAAPEEILGVCYVD